MPEIAEPGTIRTGDLLNFHSVADLLPENMHFPEGFEASSAGRTNWKDGSLNHDWVPIPLLPSVLDLRNVTAAAPPSPANGDKYLLDDSGLIFTVSAINHQSGTIVRYTFSGTPDFSAITASNVLVCTGATNEQHNGGVIITAVNDGSDFIDVDNPAVTDNSLDETTGATCELPHGDWNGAVNNNWVRFNETDGVWYAVAPSSGQKAFDKTLETDRRFDGTRWLGQKEVIGFAFSDETTSLTTGVAKVTFHMPFKFRITNVIVGVTIAPTSDDIEVDLNDDGVSILSTLIVVDAGTKTSELSGSPVTIDSTKAVVDKDSLMTVDLDQIGSTVEGAGAKIYIEGFRV